MFAQSNPGMKMKSLAFTLRSTLFLLLIAVPTARSAVPAHGRISVGYLTIGGRLSAEDSAAVSWLSGERAFSLAILDIAASRLDRPDVDVVWIHVPDSASWAGWIPLAEKLRPLASFYRNGGKLLCTDFGAMVPNLPNGNGGEHLMGLPLRDAREMFEREYLRAQINRFGGNISRTAAFIGMERSALHRKLKSLGVGSAQSFPN